MKLTTKQLRKMIKEELEAREPAAAVWSGSPERGIVKLDDGTLLVVHGGTDPSYLEKVTAGLAAMGVLSIVEPGEGVPEDVLDFLKTKHLGGNVVDIP